MKGITQGVLEDNLPLAGSVALAIDILRVFRSNILEQVDGKYYP